MILLDKTIFIRRRRNEKEFQEESSSVEFGDVDGSDKFDARFGRRNAKEYKPGVK